MWRNPCQLQQLGAFPLCILLPKPALSRFPQSLLCMLISAICVCEECYAPISSLCDTSLSSCLCPLIASNILAPCTLLFFLQLVSPCTSSLAAFSPSSHRFCWGSPLLSVLKGFTVPGGLTAVVRGVWQQLLCRGLRCAGNTNFRDIPL